MPSQLKATAKRHQLCIAHLLRELLNFEKSLENQWSAGMKDLFCRALDLKRTLNAENYQSIPAPVMAIETELDELLAVDCSAFHRRERALVHLLIKKQGQYPDLSVSSGGSAR
ncbi:MAG: hypothetical protein LBR26_07050 [Prevotella sp.]|nr:hypothetical protein [Prevotella sp.]